MAGTCGSCNFQGGSTLDKKILCLYDNTEYDAIHTCTHWRQYFSGMSKEARMQMVSNLRNRENNEDTERRHKEDLKSAELSRNLQLKLAAISFVLGIAATLFTQWIFSLWK